jgi:hypothetical protein
LNQAVKFLHENGKTVLNLLIEVFGSVFLGTMLHYDDPQLWQYYFIDPQWLCDMLAHVVTVGQVNRFIKNG